MDIWTLCPTASALGGNGSPFRICPSRVFLTPNATVDDGNDGIDVSDALLHYFRVESPEGFDDGRESVTRPNEPELDACEVETLILSRPRSHLENACDHVVGVSRDVNAFQLDLHPHGLLVEQDSWPLPLEHFPLIFFCRCHPVLLRSL